MASETPIAARGGFDGGGGCRSGQSALMKSFLKARARDSRSFARCCESCAISCADIALFISLVLA